MDTKEITQNDKNNLNNELLEDEDTLKLWIKDKFMSKMDKFAFARAFIIFALMGFYLGNNLLIFCWIYNIVYIYLYIYRMIRFYAKKSLAFLAEFCYFGNWSLVVFIWFLGTNESFFKIPFVSSTGTMSMALIIFNNRANFDSSDHITSSYLHAIPMITCWAIRWKHKIYYEAFDSGYYLNILSIKNMDFEFNAFFWEMVYLPLIFWAGWALLYIILVNTVFRENVNKIEEYGSGIQDFIKLAPLKFIFGDPRKNTIIKYIILHFLNFFISSVLGYIAFYNYYFNTIYLIAMIAILGFNTSLSNARSLERKLLQTGKKSIIERRKTIEKLELEKLESIQKLQSRASMMDDNTKDKETELKVINESE